MIDLVCIELNPGYTVRCSKCGTVYEEYEADNKACPDCNYSDLFRDYRDPVTTIAPNNLVAGVRPDFNPLTAVYSEELQPRPDEVKLLIETIQKLQQTATTTTSSRDL